MTRDEFMEIAKRDLSVVMQNKFNAILNIIERAWAEGKRNAESQAITAAIQEAVEKLTNHGREYSETEPFEITREKRVGQCSKCFYFTGAFPCNKGRTPCLERTCDEWKEVLPF